MKSIAFGGDKHERLDILVLGYGCRAPDNHHDANWLSVEVSVHCGGFHGKFPASFFTTELESFYAQLNSLYQKLTGTAEFKTLECQLALTARGDGLGHINISGEALDQAGIGNKLFFKIGVDQTQLQTSIQSLAAALSTFPVRA